jgi:hypothetical protein
LELALHVNLLIGSKKRNWREAQAAGNLKDDVIRDAYRKSVGWSLSTLNGFSEPVAQAVSKPTQR